MNYQQIGFFFLQGTLISFVILLLFRLRKKLGLEPLFACLGLLQFMQVFLASTVYISITDSFIVSPGSAVLFTATLFAVLVIYIKEDAGEIKKIIYALFIVNLVISLLLQTFGWSFSVTTAINPFNISTSFFNTSAWVLFIGTIVLFLDSLLIIVLFEFVSKKVQYLFLSILLTMLIIVCFDAVLFSLLAFWQSENLISILTSGLISKGIFVLFYSIIFYLYLKYIDVNKAISNLLNLKDVFQPLTYKQKFESVKDDIKKVREKREAELILANKEKEKRIMDLELSEKKLQYSLSLLEKKDQSLSELSKIAKIGHWEYNIATDSFTWSDYTYEVFGFNLNDKIPSRNKMVEFYDEESQKKLAKATIDLSYKGIPYDIELKLINNRKEEVWVRNIVQLIHNEQNEIIGRKGVLHNITAFKKAQLEIELSQQKSQKSLELLKNKEAALHEVSSLAKIGYWEYSIDNVNAIWSDYHFEIFGLNPKDGIPSREKLLSFFDKESQEKIEKANLKLHTEGIGFDIEVKLTNLQNKEIWVRNVVQAVYNKEREIIGRRGLLQDITESKIAKQEIQTSLKLLEQRKYSMDEASKIAKIGYWEVDTENNTSIWSDYVHYALGSNPEDGIPDISIIQKHVGKESFELFTKCTENIVLYGTPYDIEINFKNLQNKEVWIRVIAQPVYNKQNKIIGRRGLVQNITASKNAQQKIQESLNLLENSKYSMDEASKIAKIGYYEHNSVTDTYKWSDYLFTIHGFDLKKPIPSKEEFIKNLDKNSLEILNNAVLNLNTKGVSYDIEMKVFNKIKNKEIWVRSVAQPIYNDKKEIIGRRGVTQDITDKKNTEIKIKESEEKFFNIFKNSPNLITLTRLKDYQIVDANDAALKVTGYTPEEIINTNNFPNYVWTSLDNREKYFKKLIKNGQIKNFETEFVVKSGEIRFWKTSSQIIKISNEKFALNTIEDVTEIKQAQIEIQKQTEFINAMTENQPNAIIACNSEGKLVLFNKKAVEWHGVGVLNISSNIWAEKYGLYKEDGETILKEEEIPLKQAFKGQKIRNREVIIKVKNKKNRTVLCNGTSFSDSDGNILGALIVMNDITEQKKIQNDLIRNEFLLNESGRLARVGGWELDLTTQKVRWSKQVFAIHGIPEGEVPPLEDCIGFYIEGADKILAKAIETSISEKKKYDLTLRFKNRKNQKLWVNTIGYPIINKKGIVTGLRGVIQDVTDQKQSRDIIEKAERMYRILTDYSNDLISLQKPNGIFEYVSPSVKNLLGYEPSDLIGKTVFNLVHKDDVNQLKYKIEERRIKGVYNEPVSFRVVHKSGHYVWLEFLSSPVYKNNEINYFVSSSRDITQWVLAQKEINEYQTSLQKLTTEITLVEENQKKDIASNIHDHLSQSLVISNMKIKELKRSSELEVIKEGLSFIQEHVSEALANSRNITSELSPPILYQLGLVEALYWLLDNIETKHNIKCQVNDYTNQFTLSDVESILIYRSIQEIINNAIKYAKASLITVDLNNNKLGVDIIIIDNGVGFDTEKLKNFYSTNENGSGVGLFTVKERIKNIRGTFKISSKIDKGTTVEIFIPTNTLK